MQYELAIGVIFLTSLIVAVFFFRGKTADALAPILVLQKSVNDLPFEDAKSRVESFLSGNSRWKTEPATGPVTEFHSSLNSLFSTYSFVSGDDDYVRLDIRLVRPSEHRGFLVVGNCPGEGPVLLKLQSGEIFDVGLDEKPPEGMRFETVYHFLLFEILASVNEDSENKDEQ